MDNQAVAMALVGRGGRLQQQDFQECMAEAGVEQVQDRCGLVEALLYLFGWGSLSLPNVQWLASLAVATGASHPDLTKLAGIGMNGKYPNHMRRDLLSLFCRDTILPEPVEVEVT